MKVKKQELLNALNKVKPGLSTNTPGIDQASCFVFHEDMVYTFNDEIMVQAPFKCGLSCAVPAEALLAFVNRARVDELNIDFKDDQFKGSGTRVRCGINSFSDITLPLEEFDVPEDEKEWNDLSEDFLDGVSVVAGSAGSDSTEQAMECIHLDGSMMETCDGYRLTVFELKEDWVGDKEGSPDTLIPARNIIKILQHDPIQYLVTNNWVHFYNEDGSIFSTRPYEDEFQNLDDYMNVEGVEIEFPDNLGDALGDAEAFADDEVTTPVVLVSIKKNEITVKGEGSLGWLEEKVKFKYTGEPVSFQISPTFFKQILGVLPKVTIGEQAVMFKNENCTHILSIEA